MIRHIEGGWQLVSRKGKNLGVFRSYGDAVKREKEIEMFKHMKK